MDQRIAFVANLKNHLSQRNSVQNIALQALPQPQSPQDVEYQFVRRQIKDSQFFKGCSKHVRIRLQKWIERLDKINTNKVWIANRNNYIKLLNLMCHCEYLTFPFLQMPPQCDLPNLLKHQITKIIDEVEREIKTSRFTSRKVSINLENAALTKPKISTNNFYSQQKRFKTESNTYGEDESETIVMRGGWNGIKTFQTDFEDKTISFNLSSTDKNWFSKQVDRSENDEEQLYIDRYKTKPLRSNSYSGKKQLKEITNNSIHSQIKNKEQTAFKKKSKPPLYKQIKLNEPAVEEPKKGNESKANQCKHKEYWESNEVTGNNSGVGTPKYLDKYQLNSEKMDDSVVIVSYREGDDNCDCTSKMLGQGWLSQMFKKITL